MLFDLLIRFEKYFKNGNDGKWVIDFDNKELQKELASNKKPKKESYTP